MKKYLLLATALAALVSCTSDDFTGNETIQEVNENGNSAIIFGTGVNTVTRADLTGAAAAEMLNNNFVFAGTKSNGTTAPTAFVFDQYVANWVENTANTTLSNSSDWEYVSYTPATTTTLPTGAIQSIKYWDYTASQYDFAAYSLGKGTGTTPTYATPSAIAAGNKSYTLTGSVDELKACYISDLVTAYNRDDVSDYGNVVQFSFRSLAAKIRMAFYETVPGYSVKDIKFYTVAADGSASTTPALFTSDAVLPAGSGTMTITFPTTGFDKRPGGTNADTDYNKAHVAFSLAEGATAASTLTFDALADFADAEKMEADNNYIGRASNTATYAGGLLSGAGKYYTILPYEAGANLLLRIKYTLVSTDGSAEEITVDNATAVIPKELAKWNSNYAYTYIFKISDITNGTTGINAETGDPEMGLTPITLNAVVVDSEDGVQETITTVSDPSITTYTKGKVVTENDEYVSGNTIYVIVNSGTSNETLTVGTNANLYTVTLEDGAAQTISEESVDNALANGTYDSTAKTYTVTDANGKNLVVTESDLLDESTKIEATDSPTGNEISVVGAKFEAGAAGTTYVFQYIEEARTYYTAAQANAYNAALTGAISTNDEAYSFTSYGSDSGSPQYGTGKVKVVSQANGWTTVLVTSNNPEDTNAANFVGQQFKVKATTLAANTYYPLYTAAGAATGIYVTVATSSFDSDDVNAYNATLAGAASTSTVKTPGEYGYKIIKIAQ